MSLSLDIFYSTLLGERVKSIYFRRVSNLWILDLDFETVVFFHNNNFISCLYTWNVKAYNTISIVIMVDISI
jgi:hypothetical protein